jgi:hypothetical protein
MPLKGEILKSNVGAAQPEAPARAERASPLPLILAGVLLLILGAGAALFWTSNQQRSQQAAASATVAARPAATGTAAAGVLPPINGISCDALESTVVHIHLHLAIFINGEEQQVPLGIGIGQPWEVTSSAEGPFVSNGSCFYWLHTHTQDGIIHIESPVRRRFSLGDFFAIWQVPLSANQVGDAQGQVITDINGQRSSMNPPDITLLPHQRIQLDVAGDVPPEPFDFPPGD